MAYLQCYSPTKKGNTIIGRFETIKKLEEKTNKQKPTKYLAEIDLLDDDNEVQILDTGTVNIVAIEEEKNSES